MTFSRRTLLGVGAGAVVAAGAGAAWYASRAQSPMSGQAPIASTGVPPSGEGLMAERAIGRADAPVVVREFFSLTCSHCASFHRDTMPRVKSELVETGRVRMVFHDFPLDQVALTAAVVARHLPPASYEPFVAALLASQERWAFARGVNTTDELAKMAALAGMGRAAFDAAIADQSLRTELLKARDEAGRVWGIDSTPSFVFDGPASKGQKAAGARPFDDFARLVQQAAG